MPGARARRAQVAEFAERWRRSNEAPGDPAVPLWVVLGDSTAQRIGASSVVTGYVGQVRARRNTRLLDDLVTIAGRLPAAAFVAALA